MKKKLFVRTAIEDFQIAKKNETHLECFIKYGFLSELTPHEGKNNVQRPN